MIVSREWRLAVATRLRSLAMVWRAAPSTTVSVNQMKLGSNLLRLLLSFEGETRSTRNQLGLRRYMRWRRDTTRMPPKNARLEFLRLVPNRVAAGKNILRPERRRSQAKPAPTKNPDRMKPLRVLLINAVIILQRVRF